MDHHHHHSGTDTDSADALAELLELGAEVLHGYLSDAIAWVHSQAPDRPLRRIVDLGSGTGAAAIALAQRFADAEVLAVDAPAEMLSRVHAKARDLGLAARVGHPRAAGGPSVAAGLPPLPAATGRYAQLFLQHIRAQLDEALGAEDLATLDRSYVLLVA